MLSFFIAVLNLEFRNLGRKGIWNGYLQFPAFTALSALLSFPSVRLTHRDHGAKNRIPCLRFQHHLVGEHAAVPTNMLERFRQFSLIVAKPISGIPGNV